MLDNKRTTPIIALIGAVALLASTPAFAQTAASSAAPAASSTTPDAAPSGAPADSSAAAPADSGTAAPLQINGGNQLTISSMFLHASLAVKLIITGLALASLLSLTIFLIKLIEFAGLNRASDKFLEAFRSAKSITEINRIATSEEFEGTPMADMAAAATTEIELSRQAGLAVAGEFRDSTISRASSAVQAVQALLTKRLGGGMTFLASVGSNSPFIGLFGTVIGIMISFISIANTHTTSLASVAPGIAEALLATAFGLGAAIPAVIFYNIFQSRISAFGTRAEGFVAELMNALSRQLDKGA
jgi:biopolymer transport protein ExbB